MKKSFLFIAAMLLSTTFVAAQEFVYFGAKGGVNFSNFSGDGFSDFEDGKARTAYHLGLVAEIPVSDRFSVQPEVLYSAQGFDIARIEDSQDVEFQLDYITVPVMAKFYLIDGFNIHAGPQLGFLVENKISSELADSQLDSENFNNFDLSLGLGAGYKFQSFFVYGRYNAGMSEIYEDEGVDTKNSVVQAGIGFLF